MDLNNIKEGDTIKVRRIKYNIVKIIGDTEVSSDSKQEMKEFLAIELVRDKEKSLRPTNQISFYQKEGQLYFFDLEIKRNGTLILKNKTKLKEEDVKC